MIQFARLLEAADHQFLLRACNDASLVGMGGAGPVQCLTIDTVHPVADKEQGFENFRVCLGCRGPRELVAIFHAFTEDDCEDALWIMRRMYTKVYSPEQAKAAIDGLGRQLAARIGAVHLGTHLTHIDPDFRDEV